MKIFFILLFSNFVIIHVTAQRRQDLIKIEKESKSENGSKYFFDGNQPIEEPDNSEEDRKKEFLKFYIPSSILFAGIEPAAVSKLNVAFGDDIVELKLGKVLGETAVENLDNSVAINISVAAPSGSKTIFEYDNVPRDISAGIHFTHLMKHKARFIDIQDPQTERVFVSREAQWLNINIILRNSKGYFFSDDFNYTTEYNYNFRLQANYNFYYNAWYGKLPRRRHIVSTGIGIGHFDNYQTLEDYTIHKGIIDPVNNFFGEIESVTGKRGVLEKEFGLLLSVAGFKPITKYDALTNVMFGVNINSFGLGSSNHYMNGNGGFYISKRSFEKDNEDNEHLKEDFSVGILADFADLTTIGEDGYFKDHFKVILTAQIPLRFFD